MIWSFKKDREEIEQLEAEVVELKKETAEIKGQRPKVDRLVTQMHKHLEENNLGNRLYLAMIDSRR